MTRDAPGASNSMRFCPECGSPVIPGAKFCVGCGLARAWPTALGAGAAGEVARAVPLERAGSPEAHLTPAFAAVFAGLLVLGLPAAAIVLRQEPGRERQLASAAAGTGSLPPGHPGIVKIPEGARKFIDDLETKANA